MIDQIVKMREDGLSFRKIASKLNTTVGKVQYRYNKWNNESQQTDIDSTKSPKSAAGIAITEDCNLLKGEMQAKLVSPRKVMLFWEVSEIPKKIIQVYFELNLDELVHLVRLYDVTDILFTGNNAHHYYEIAVPYNKGFWFVKGLPANRSYICELGVKLNNSEFFSIYRSNSFRTPEMTIPTGNEMYRECIQYQQREDSPPKWIDHVSTYSYYSKSNYTGAEE